MIILNSKIKTYKVKNNKNIFGNVFLGSNLSTFSSNSKTSPKYVGLNQRNIFLTLATYTTHQKNVFSHIGKTEPLNLTSKFIKHKINGPDSSNTKNVKSNLAVRAKFIKSNKLNNKLLNQATNYYKNKSRGLNIKSSSYSRLGVNLNMSRIGSVSSGVLLSARQVSMNRKKTSSRNVIRSVLKKIKKSENFLSEVYNFNYKFLNYNYCKFMVNNLIILINSMSSVHNGQDEKILKLDLPSEEEETSNIINFKNSGYINSVNIEGNSINSNLTLVVKFLNSFDNLLVTPSSIDNTKEQDNRDQYTEKKEESSIDEAVRNELLISKFKYNKSLFNTLNPFSPHLALGSKVEENNITVHGNPT
jgi:hypothetical protein